MATSVDRSSDADANGSAEYEVSPTTLHPSAEILLSHLGRVKEQSVVFSGVTGGFETEVSPIRASVHLEHLKILESLGGSAGFEKWLQDTQNGRNIPPIPSSLLPAADIEPNDTYAATVQILFVGLYFTLEVNVLGTGVSGKGWCWGIGAGYINGGGPLQIEGSLNDLKKAKNFMLWSGSSGGGGGQIVFMNESGSQSYAVLTFVGAGLGAGVGGSGEFKFTGF